MGVGDDEVDALDVFGDDGHADISENARRNIFRW